MPSAKIGAVLVDKLHDPADRALGLAFPSARESEDAHLPAVHEVRVCMPISTAPPDAPPKCLSQHHIDQSYAGMEQQQLLSDNRPQQADSSSSSSCAHAVQSIRQEPGASAGHKLPRYAVSTAPQLAGTTGAYQHLSSCGSIDAAATCPASINSTDPATVKPTACHSSKPAGCAAPSVSTACLGTASQPTADSAPSRRTLRSEGRGTTCSRAARRRAEKRILRDEETNKNHQTQDTVDATTCSKQLLEEANTARAALVDPSNKLHLYVELLRPCMGEALTYSLLFSLVTRRGIGGRQRQQHPTVHCSNMTDRQLLRIVENREAAARSKLREKISKELPAMREHVQALQIKAPKEAELASAALHRQLFELFQQYPIYSRWNPVYIPNAPDGAGIHVTSANSTAAAGSQDEEKQQQQDIAHAAALVETSKQTAAAAHKQKQSPASPKNSGDAIEVPGAASSTWLGKRRAAAVAELAFAKLTRGNDGKALTPMKSKPAVKIEADGAATAVNGGSNKTPAVAGRVCQPTKKEQQQQQVLCSSGGSVSAPQAGDNAFQAGTAVSKPHTALVARPAATACGGIIGEAAAVEDMSSLLVSSAAGDAAADTAADAAVDRGDKASKPAAMITPKTGEKTETVQGLLLLAKASKGAYCAASQGLESTSALEPAKPQGLGALALPAEPQGSDAVALPAEPQAQAGPDNVKAEPPCSTGSSQSMAVSGTTVCTGSEGVHSEVAAAVTERCDSLSISQAVTAAVANAGVAGTVRSSSSGLLADDGSSAVPMPVPQQQCGGVGRPDGNSSSSRTGVWQMLPQLECIQRLQPQCMEVDVPDHQGQHQQQHLGSDSSCKSTIISNRNRSTTAAPVTADSACPAADAAFSFSSTMTCSDGGSMYTAATAETAKAEAAAAAFTAAQCATDALQHYAPQLWKTPTYDVKPAAVTAWNEMQHWQPEDVVSRHNMAAAQLANATLHSQLFTAPNQQPFVLQPSIHSCASVVSPTVAPLANSGATYRLAAYNTVGQAPLVTTTAACNSSRAATGAIGASYQAASTGPRLGMTPDARAAANWAPAAAAVPDSFALHGRTATPDRCDEYCYAPDAAPSATAAGVMSAVSSVPAALPPGFKGTFYAMTAGNTVAMPSMGLAAGSAAPLRPGCFRYSNRSSSSSFTAATIAAAAAAYDDDAVLAAGILADLGLEDAAAAAAQIKCSTGCTTEVLCEYDNEGDPVMFSHPALGDLSDCKQVSGMGALLLDSVQLYGL